jgi:hypothetical protein
MAVGRISGPLLAQNLFRDNIPLAFYNTSSSQAPVLYLDVQTGRVGIQRDTPAYTLDVAGIANADQLRTTTATIGNFIITTSTITTNYGPAIIRTGAGDDVVLDSRVLATGVTRINAGVESKGTDTGSLLVNGGVGIGGQLFVGSYTNIQSEIQSFDPATGALVVNGGVGIGMDLWVGGVIHGVISTSSVSATAEQANTIHINATDNGVYFPVLSGALDGYISPQTTSTFTFDLSTGTLTTPKLQVNNTVNVDGLTTFTSTASSISTDTGAVVVAGGVGIGGDLNVGGNIHAIGNITAEGNIQLGNNTATDTLLVEAEIDSDLIPKQDNLYTVGKPDKTWAEGFFNNLYTNLIESQTGSVTINPADNILQVNANIRVSGDKPIGTAPVVTNVLYVTMDGSDTNDGRAEDAGRACRTIAGALKSPYYAPGTSIRVAPGRYLEMNPLVLLPYTSIIGSDLRTTVIEPINRTQDLFHVQSGCYLAQMQFLNGRSGRLPGDYASGYNRGAYAVAFPPQVGGNKIDVFHSPYVQNCTNQSGPWLLDGSMFQPNGTVQIPLAAGVGTWDAGTSTITVSVSTGTITLGMSINSGPQDPGFFNARTLLLANKPFIQEQVVAYVNQTYPTFEYQQAKCFRDVGIILENVSYDSTFGGNEKSVEAGLSYYNGVTSVIAGQETQTVAAINYINTLAQDIIQNNSVTDLLSGSGEYSQVINTALTDGSIAGNSIANNLGIITDIITNGTVVAPDVYKSTGPDNSLVSAEILLQANRVFIQKDTLAWITNTYPTFVYNQDICYRDVGLIVDAVSQDILLGGNTKTIEAGISYWKGGYAQILGQESTTTQAISHARDVALSVINNTSVTPESGNTGTQVINTFFENGIVAAPAVSRNFDIINTIILNGLAYVPESYQGGGLFSATGLSGDDVKIAPKVTGVTDLGGGDFSVTIDKPTVGYAINSTLYFGDTAIFPALDADVPDEWAQRRVDTLGAMGGMLVDGSVVSSRSPIASMVLNAYTQVSQGGRGIHIINNGYAQLVSIFTIFCNVAVECDTGGIASITNSNSNFGDTCLIAKSYGRREFSGTVYNPAYPTNVPNGEYYPAGYWPQNGRTLIFVPDTANRPHIALVMEVEPPPGYVNDQGFAGFLTADSNVSTLTTGSIVISGIDTTDIAIGQTLFVRDQYGRTDDGLGNSYVTSGTVITDINYQSITLSKEINQGGGDTANPNYFTLYTCGNAYYTVLSSALETNPVTVGKSMIPGQTGAEADALKFINTLTHSIISNTVVPIIYSLESQVILSTVTGGDGAKDFIGDRIGIIADIATNGVGVAPAITKTGTIPSGAGSAITLIEANVEFITQETVAYIQSIYPLLNFDTTKCARDVGLILQQLIYDLEKGGNYYSVYSGLSYWSRAGTYHVVELGENLNNPRLMPDGAIVNFYQRSYMSASGYTFEYVGAGMNYGSLPQVGRADPVQSKEVVQLDGGKVFFTSTDQNGDFRIGPGLVISQATGVLSGRTFTKSLFANLTPFILAIESGA